MTTTRRPRLGIAAVLAAALLWGTTGTAQALAGGTLAPAWFGALRLLLAAAFFLVVAAGTGGLRRAAWGGLQPAEVLGAGLCMAVYNLAFFAGVRLTGVALGTAIALGSGPLWAGLLQAALQRVAPSPRWWTATAVAMAGGTLLSLDASPGAAGAAPSAVGIALCATSGLAYAAYTVLGKRMADRAPAATITLAAFAIASALAVPAAWLAHGAAAIGAREALAAGYTGIVTAGIAYLLFAHALRHIAPATGVTLALLEPAVAFVLAVAVLGEHAGAGAAAGIVLVLAGVLGVVRAELAPRRRSQDLRTPGSRRAAPVSAE